MRTSPIIKDIDFGIAFRIKNVIYLNKRLKKYPELRKKLIEHEIEHTDSFKLKDITNDLTGNKLQSTKRQYYKFLFTEHKAWYQLIPIIKINNVWTIDILLSIFWISVLIVLVITLCTLY